VKRYLAKEISISISLQKTLLWLHYFLKFLWLVMWLWITHEDKIKF